jgi:hypothetical protein
MKKRELLAQQQEGAWNYRRTEVGSYRPLLLSAYSWAPEWLTLLSLLLVPSSTCANTILYFPWARRVQNIACQALCYFEVCIPQASIRYGSCLLDSCFLDRSFKVHFLSKLDGFDIIEAQCTKKRSQRKDKKFFRFLALKVFFDYLAFEKGGGGGWVFWLARPPPMSKRVNKIWKLKHMLLPIRWACAYKLLLIFFF